MTNRDPLHSYQRLAPTTAETVPAPAQRVTSRDGSVRELGSSSGSSAMPELALGQPSAREVQQIEVQRKCFGDPSLLKFASSSGFRKQSDMDVVQYTAMHYFVEEHEGEVSIDIMRIGKLDGPATVQYRTVDCSAEDGKRYTGVQGQLDFKTGEAMKSVSVKIIATTNFDTTLTFRMELHDPRNCRLDSSLKSVPIYILDDDFFPSDRLQTEIQDPDIEALLSVSLTLLWEYFKFTFFSVPTVWWKSILTLMLDQLRNVYYLSSIFMRVYLVDVILNVKNPDSAGELIIPGNRAMSAICLAAAWTLPNLFLTALDRYVVGNLDMGFAIRKHLRVNVFRKYLNYTDESRLKVGIQDLTEAQSSSIPQLVEGGYLGIYDMIKDLGKICCVAIFILRSHPHSALPLVVFPGVILLFMRCRQSKSLHLSEKASEGTSASQNVVAQACNGIDIIRDYEQKYTIVSKYENSLKSQRDLTLELTIFEWWNEQLIPWLTLMSIGTYMGLGALEVLNEGISIGTFLATINVYKDLGDRFAGVHKKMNDAKNAIEPLLELTNMLNFPIELPNSMKINRQRRLFINLHMKQFEDNSTNSNGSLGLVMDQTFWDTIPITFTDVSFAHIPQIAGFSAKVKLGSMVLVFGPQGSGKGHLLKVISGHVKPTVGKVLYSPHHTVLQLRQVPEIITWLDLLENLRFGSAIALAHPGRVRSIFQIISAMDDDHWLMVQLDAEIKELTNGPTDRTESNAAQFWYLRLSHQERKLIHISRAFIFSPQILVLHKPLDDLDKEVAIRILELFSDYVHKGHHDKKRRTVFISSGTYHMRNLIQKCADYKWDLSQGIVTHNVNSFSATHATSSAEALSSNGMQAWTAWSEKIRGEDRSCGVTTCWERDDSKTSRVSPSE